MTALLLPVSLIGAFYVWPNTALGRKAILEAPAPHEVASFVEEEERYGAMVGKSGTTVTALNPAGIVRIDGHRVHCLSEGMILEQGEPVRVISAKGNRVVVRRMTADAMETPDPSSSPMAGDEPPLDFDMT